MFLSSKGRPLVFKCVGLVKAGGTEAQKRELVLIDNDAGRSWNATGSALTMRRFLVTDKPTKAVNEVDAKLQRPYRSVLEEVLIKEEEQPKTTAQKGLYLV